MKASEILQGLAELLAGIEQDQSQEVVQQPNKAELVAVQVDNTDNTEAGVFVPPLQAKLELLKKAVNVDSIYDQGGADEQMTGQGADKQDELSRMKQMAGINPVALDAAADTEPLDV